MAQSKVLQGDLTVAAAEHREESKQVEQESDHCAEIFAVSAPTDQSLGDGRSFGEGQATTAALMAGAYVPAAGERVGVVVCGGNTTAVEFS